MNINNFKQQLPGGGARSNQFRVNGTFPAAAAAAAGVNPANQIQFLAWGASIPLMSIGEVPVWFQGRALKLPGDRSFPNWKIRVYNDNTFQLRNAFEKWHDVMNRIESNVSRQSLSEFAQTWSVTQLDRTGADVKQYKFIDIWPVTIGQIELSFEQQEQIESFEVDFCYQYYQSEGTSS